MARLMITVPLMRFFIEMRLVLLLPKIHIQFVYMYIVHTKYIDNTHTEKNANIQAIHPVKATKKDNT